MKTLLVSVDSKFIHTNLALRYIKNYCKGEFDITIKEFTINQKLEFIMDEIVNQKADLVCFSCYIWNIEYIKQIIYILKTAYPSTKILLGGPEVSYEVEKIMEENNLIDYIIYGEGEVSFHKFMETLHENGKLSDVNGLVYRENNKIIKNQPVILGKDLDYLISPYGENEKYYDKIIYYESSRGCPFNCSFCMSSIDKTVRNFSMDRVKKDLSLLLKMDARQIKFVDRTFNANYKRAMEIMQFIVDNNTNNMTIHFEITADIINDEFLDFLKKMPTNMFQLEVGIQSLNPNTLDEINRSMHLDKLIHVINRIKENNNMHMHLDLIAGLPYENYESFKQSFNKIHNLYADKLQLGFLKVLKGTKIYADKQKHEIYYNEKAPYEIIRNKYMSYEEILKLKNIEELVDRYNNERYFDTSLKYLIKNYYNNSPFDFYEDFSYFWKRNNLYMAMHNRKKLYVILYDFVEEKQILTEEFKNKLVYDFLCCNEREELISIFDRNSEENLKVIKKIVAKDKDFRKQYFNVEDDSYRIFNDFRIVEIANRVILFVYKNKENIFERCKIYDITKTINKIKEQKSEE